MPRKIQWFLLFVGGSLAFGACGGTQDEAEGSHGGQALKLYSPDSLTEVLFRIDKWGQPHLQASYKGQSVFGEGQAIGLRFKSGLRLDTNLRLLQSRITHQDTLWEQPWGQQWQVRDRYRQVRLSLGRRSSDSGQLTILVRLYDEGFGFRYRLPEQPGLDSFVVSDERSNYQFAPADQVWWFPAYGQGRYEFLYEQTPLGHLDTAYGPLTIERENGLVLCLHEAHLSDYASQTYVGKADGRVEVELIPWANGDKVRGSAPFQSPWRTFQLGEKPADLLASPFLLKFNPPCRLEDTDWIKPSKYLGIWWGMHIDKYSWYPGPDLGATTENAKRYIDFAAEHDIPQVLVEGWNKGWTRKWQDSSHLFSYTEPNSQFALREVQAYAQERGVTLMSHHETSCNLKNYLPQMDEAYGLLNELGIPSVKMGFVGPKLNGEQWIHGQFGVRNHRRMLRAAARHKVALNIHEPVMASGERRTYPHMLSREGVRGQEYNAWSSKGANPPEHTAVLPFTRGLAGPIDFTPGIFDLKIPEKRNRVNTTLAKQLALYVVIFSPLQMAADLPEHYRERPDAFCFIEQVPTNWEKSLALNGAIGDYVTLARKDRHSDRWFLGSITDEKPRKMDLALDFLEAGKTYQTTVYKDGPETDLEDNPTAIATEASSFQKGDTLHLDLKAGGGAAVVFEPK